MPASTASGRKRQRPVTEVAMMRSSVSTRVVYRSRGNPANSLPVDLSTVRSFTPPVTCVAPSITCTAASRVPWPLRTNE